MVVVMVFDEGAKLRINFFLICIMFEYSLTVILELNLLYAIGKRSIISGSWKVSWWTADTVGTLLMCLA